VATPEKRFDELRALALASDVKPVGDPRELARRGILGHLAALGHPLPQERPEVDVQLFGSAIVAHEVSVRNAAPVLLAIQETIASIGQALRHDPTLHGVIQAQILAATELHMTPEITAGSVIFHLLGPSVPAGDEAGAPTDGDVLVDAAIKELLALVERSASVGPDSSELAQELRRLGPRTAKHLSDLIKLVMGDEVEVGLDWRSQRGQRQHAVLGRTAAVALERAIAMNKVDTRIVELVGDMVTVSMAVKPELRTDSGKIQMAADKALAATLGPFFNRRVVATVEQLTTWSTSTGKEQRKYRLLEVREAEATSSDDEES